MCCRDNRSVSLEESLGIVRRKEKLLATVDDSRILKEALKVCSWLYLEKNRAFVSGVIDGVFSCVETIDSCWAYYAVNDRKLLSG